MNLTNQTQLGHYKILQKLGAGGMGEVYLAEDMKLDRRVALKILPQEFATDADRMNRFIREAKSASALNHPNIITIHEIGECDGTHFIATEFIDGKTLTEYAKAKSPDVKSILDFAVQIASALAEAHRAGIVHRDIKPDNVMIRADGLAKILDFGIAKLSAPPNGAGEDDATALKSQTQAGMIIGTANYMSPEQAAGRAVDARSDVFSFGVVLYEMLSGHLPFAGETVMEMIGAILHKEPQTLGAGVPPEIKTIVGKCLQKERDERYQTIAEVCRDLKEFKQELEFREKLERTAAPNRMEAATQIIKANTTAEENQKSEIQNLKSIVVLPFTNIGADAEDDYFSDGLTEEIISDLSKIRSLCVISRNSAMRLKGTAKDLKTITEELNVRYVLDGSVRKAGRNLRISVQLIDGATDANLWSEKYSGTLEDIFEMQESVSRSIAEALKITLTTGEIEQIAERPIADARAYDLYLRARAKLMQGNPAALDRSIELLKQGLEIIGENELLYAALGYTYYFYFKWISKLDEEYLRLANECMEKVFALNPDSTHGFSLKGFLSYSEGNVAEAARALKRAVEFDPNNAEALLWLTIYSEYFEDNHAEALRYAEEARRLDPLLPANTLVIGFVEIYSGNFGAEPLSWIERGFAMDSSAPLFNWLAIIGKAWCGKISEAIAHADRLVELAPGWVYTEHALFLKHALRGEKDAALAHYTPDFEREAEHDCHFALHVAHCFALIGEKEKALDFLALSVRKGMLNYSFIGKYDPLLENIRYEKRFKDLIEEAKRLSEQKSGRQNLESQRKAENLEEEKTHILQAASTDENKESEKQTNPPEAGTVMLQSNTAEESANVEVKSEPATNPKSKIQNPKSKWWLFGLLALVVLVGGFFGYKYLFTPTSKQIESIAVMPFVNESGNADVEYLSDGMTETLIGSLSQLPNLNVKPRSTVFRYKGKETDPQTIGKELNVQAILIGRVVQRGQDISLFVELIDISSDKVVWSETYNRKQTDLVALQADIARDVSGKIKTRLSGADVAKVTKTYTTNPEAYQLYLKGNFYLTKYTEGGVKKGIEYYEKAIAIDPNYALAYHGIAAAYDFSNGYYLPANESEPKAKAAALKALELDDTLAETHFLLGKIVFWYEWDWATAERHWKRANELDPTYPTYYPVYLAAMGRFDEAVKAQEVIVQRLPLDLNMKIDSAGIFLAAGRSDQSIEQTRKALELDPNFWWAYQFLGLAYERKKQYEEAVAALEKARLLDVNPSNLGYLGYVYAAAGKKAEAQKVLGELKELSKQRYVSPYSIACVYAGLNDKDRAFEWLERAYQDRSHYLTLLKTETVLDNLRPDPRFKDLLRRMNLPE